MVGPAEKDGQPLMERPTSRGCNASIFALLDAYCQGMLSGKKASTSRRLRGQQQLRLAYIVLVIGIFCLAETRGRGRRAVFACGFTHTRI